MKAAATVLAPKSSLCSSIRRDAYRARTGPKAYEWWYFDALSDDGREAVVIVFSDNFVFSPRYASASNPLSKTGESASENTRFPAVSFLYSVDGKAVYRTINEFTMRQFRASSDAADCSIGPNSFQVESIQYGTGHLVTVDIPIGPSRRIKGTFEWLSIESDLLDDEGPQSPSMWNIVSPRSDVTGRIELVDRRGGSRQTAHFRGTGYHDHIDADGPMHETVRTRNWGRAHFPDTTAVFCTQDNMADGAPTTRILLVRDGKLYQRDAVADLQQFRRDKFGIKYPGRLGIVSDDNIRLRVKPLKRLESSFFEIRFLSEITLMLRDGKARKTLGITQVVEPRRIRYRLFRWFTDLQIGKRDKGPIL